MKKIPKELGQLFEEAVGRRWEENVPLKEYSTFKIGGKADHFFEARCLEDLERAVDFAQTQGISFYVIGAGSNLLFADEGYRGLIIKNSAKGITVSQDPPWLEAVSGTMLGEVVQKAQQAGLSGLEFLAGIPGTVGGAVWGNAGAFGSSIADVFLSGVIWGKEGRQEVNRDFFSFGYRHSSLREKKSLLFSARFCLQKEKREIIEKRVAEIMALRRVKHPPENTACAGSFFKNVVMPDGQKIAAGLLLDQAGVKGLKRGEAVVYSGHANFILNLGRAKARDVLELAGEMKRRVKEKFGIDLEEEVIYLEATASMLQP